MPATDTGSIAIIILAAGNSSRLGRPKQTLLWQGIPLLRQVAHAALESDLGPVVVVTGAYESEVAAAVSGLPLTLLQNENWSAGMASGIVLGIQKMQDFLPAVSGAILAVSDQPLVNAALFKALAAAHFAAGKKIIVASEYAGTLGTPVLFGSAYFEDLQQLSGQEGAKKLLRTFRASVVAVPFAGGAFDVDTEEDWERLCGEF